MISVSTKAYSEKENSNTPTVKPITGNRQRAPHPTTEARAINHHRVNQVILGRGFPDLNALGGLMPATAWAPKAPAATAVTPIKPAVKRDRFIPPPSLNVR
ncbi:MAG: hypothetical protein CM15mP74_06020 [Halieaceae bacterium]|nr:MAG: hypothetical protein CM15mP74_06020 [Halieaceae bacterium]